MNSLVDAESRPIPGPGRYRGQDRRIDGRYASSRQGLLSALATSGPFLRYERCDRTCACRARSRWPRSRFFGPGCRGGPKLVDGDDVEAFVGVGACSCGEDDAASEAWAEAVAELDQSAKFGAWCAFAG